MTNEITITADNDVDITVEVEPLVYEVIVEHTGAQGPQGAQGIPGVAAPSVNPLTWSRRGYQYVDVGDQLFYVDHPGTDLGLRITLRDAPTGSDFIVAIRKNGTVIGRATILDGATTSGYSTFAPGTVSPGDYFTIDVEQIGSTDPGHTLTVTLWMRVTP